MKKILIFICCLTSLVVFPQQKLEELINETEKITNERNQRILDYKKSTPETILTNEKRLLWDIMNGKPIYIENFNLNSENALRTNYLKRGLYGLDLKGDGLSIGIWEVGGIPEVMHPEFMDDNSNTRIINKDGSISETFHATHVAGTLIAKGNDPTAEGMATGAVLNAYDATDDKIEVITALGKNEIIVSNHSYGFPVKNLEGNEWFMGAYSQEAKSWDDIINLFPYYTPVFAAGNDGNTLYDGGFFIGYDKLTGSTNSKNTLVVSNANIIDIERRTGVFSNATINSGSSQGPTDDGRIKPDITGLGSRIYSTALNEGYGTATGTSMASPNVAGSALLLQELHRNLYGQFMLSSTLKGLISVTADDAGSTGPDPNFGWGIMNSKRASEAIINNYSDDIIEEKTLNQDQTQTIRVQNNSGKIMKVAIAWNDPAGVAIEEIYNDTTPVLVNDLDVRIKNLNNDQIYFPWLLDINNPSTPALKGDNIVDNIEIIEIDQQGLFDITISHKNDLSQEKQIYSIIVLNGKEQNLSNSNFESNSIIFWPNPVKNNLNITTKDFRFNDDISVSIYDMTGRKILSLSDFNNPNALNIDVSTLSNGVYIVNLTDGQHSIQSRIIKE